MINNNIFSILMILILVFSIVIPSQSVTKPILFQSIDSDPPVITYLAEDTISYFSVPKNATLTILFQHTWAIGNATFTLYDKYGQWYNEISFNYNESLTSKSFHFNESGTYKLVATGIYFRYQLQFSGPQFDWKYVTAAMPHKPMFRVKNNENTSFYIPVSEDLFNIHIRNDFTVPGRNATVKIYNETDVLQETVFMDSTLFDESYNHIVACQKNSVGQVFWRIEIIGLDYAQSKVVVWTNQSQLNLATGHCTLLTPDPMFFFIPQFEDRNITLQFESGIHQSCIGSSGYVDIDSDVYPLCQQGISDLNLKSSKHGSYWGSRERQGSIPMNDNADPFHINWNGFYMDPFDQRMQFYLQHNITPILCLLWDSTAHIDKHPAFWNQTDIDEFAEFCLAIAIHCSAPDLEDPPINRTPYPILGIMPFNEPNLIFNQYLGLEDACAAYINIIESIGQRFANHSDERINNVSFVVPGICPHQYGKNELYYWIEQMLMEIPEYVDLLFWDQYQYYFLEELDEYGKDIQQIQYLLDLYNHTAPLGLSEFGIHAGIPTIQGFYGSTFSKLYLFGSLANNINNHMEYPIYFSLFDSGFEPRHKGLFTSTASDPPYSDLPPFSRKPQYYSMETISNICNGTILNINYTCQQLDAIGSENNELIKIGISNRYEAYTTIDIPIHFLTSISIINVTGTHYELISHEIQSNNISVTIPPWSLYYFIIGNATRVPVADFSWIPQYPQTNTPIEFSDLSFSPGKNIISWQWDFQDGNISTQQNPIHEYDSAGIYYVTLTVWDDGGDSDSHSKIIPVGLSISYIQELLTGWNLIGLPFNNSVDKTDFLLKYDGYYYGLNDGIINTFMYKWDRAGQYYNFANTFYPGYGYWVFSYEDCELWIEELTPNMDDYITTLESGWNVIGLPFDQTIDKVDVLVDEVSWDTAVSNGWIIDFVYGWDRAGQNYLFADIFEPGEAYWVFAYQPCVLKRVVE